MKLTVNVTFYTSQIENSINKRFGLGSKAQEEWSKIVWYGSSEYMPFKDGRFYQHSYLTSEPLFAHGEIQYVAPPEINYPYLPRFLWDGKSQHGARIIQNYTTETNAKAGGQWVNRAKNNDLSVWINEFQDLIDKGSV